MALNIISKITCLKKKQLKLMLSKHCAGPFEWGAKHISWFLIVLHPTRPDICLLSSPPSQLDTKRVAVFFHFSPTQPTLHASKGQALFSSSRILEPIIPCVYPNQKYLASLSLFNHINSENEFFPLLSLRKVFSTLFFPPLTATVALILKRNRFQTLTLYSPPKKTWTG